MDMSGPELELKSRNVEGPGPELERGGRALESDGRVLPALTKDRRREGEKERRREGRCKNHLAIRPADSTMPAARSIAPMDDPSKLTEVLGRMNAQIYLKEVGSKTTHKMGGHGSRIPGSRSILEKGCRKLTVCAAR